MEAIKIIECPRDAMQGIKAFIPTARKVTYIQSLLRVGFDTIDVGSFVSPKAIPQMKDTAEVLAQLLPIHKERKSLHNTSKFNI
jgi:hydroxymethylglutaryl-CoA lyase